MAAPRKMPCKGFTAQHAHCTRDAQDGKEHCFQHHKDSAPYMVVRQGAGSVVTDDELRTMIAACNHLMVHVCDAWTLNVPTIVFRGDQEQDKLHSGVWLFDMIGQDPRQEDGTMAYHSVELKEPVGFILTQTIQKNHSSTQALAKAQALASATTGAGGSSGKKKASEDELVSALSALKMDERAFVFMGADSVASALFHELAEALVDPGVNVGLESWTWMKDSRTGTEYLREICDPVENNAVPLNVTWGKGAGKQTQSVTLCDFVYPSWFVRGASGSRFNYCDTLTVPFSLSSGGYYITKGAGGEFEFTYGKKVPAWKKTLKENVGRIARHSSA